MGILAEIGEDYIVTYAVIGSFFWKCINLKRFIACVEGERKGEIYRYMGNWITR